MAANLTPQYHKAEEEFRRSATKEDELKWLQVMLRELPKHKSSEKIQSDLKQRISKTRAELEKEKTSPKKTHGVRIPRQGAGMVLILGGPNSGKSSLLAALTRATPEIAPYPFTTHAPQPGMMEYEDVAVQLVDTPPITEDFMGEYMQGLIRSADLVLLLVDLAVDEGIEQLQALLDRLQETKTRLANRSYLDENDIGLSYTRTLMVPNKCDAAQAMERLEILHELCPTDFDEIVTSTTTQQGLNELRKCVFDSLGVIRVYCRPPGAKDPDMEKPFTIPVGGTVQDVAEQIHQDLAKNLRSARIWGKNVHDGTVAKPDHVLQDKDIVELHM